MKLIFTKILTLAQFIFNNPHFSMSGKSVEARLLKPTHLLHYQFLADGQLRGTRRDQASELAGR